MKFSTKLVLLYSLLLLAGFAVLAGYGQRSSIRILEEEIRARLEDHASHDMREIGRMLHERYLDLKGLAGAPFITSNESSPRRISGRLKAFRENHPYYSSLALFDTSGVKIAGASERGPGGSERSAPFRKDIAAGREFSMAVSGADGTGSVVLSFAHRVRDRRGEPLGVVAAIMPFGALHEIAVQRAAPGNGRETKWDLLDSDGRVLYSNTGTGVLMEQSDDWASIRELVSSGARVGSSRHLYRDEDEITAFARIEGAVAEGTGTGWILIVCTPAAEALLPVAEQRKTFLLALFAIGVIIIAATIVVSKSVTKPIIALSRAAREIGRGNLDVRVDDSAQDEIGLLSAAFNGMAIDLKESERKYKDLAEFLPQVVYEIDGTGRVLFANRHGLELFGYAYDDFQQGLNAGELFAPGDRERLLRNLQQGMRGEVLENVEYRAVRKDGTVFPLLTFAAPLRRGDVIVGLRGIGIDITERRKAEEKARLREETVAKHNSALVALAKSEKIYGGDLAVAFQAITETAAYALSVSRVSVWFYINDRIAIQCIDQVDIKSGAHSSGAVLEASVYPSYFKALQDELHISADNALSDPRTREFSESYLKPNGITSMLDVPIRIAGEVIGVVCSEQVGAPRAWTVEEQGFVTAVAGFTSIAIETRERKKAEAEILKLNEGLEMKIRERTQQLLDAQDELVRKEKLSTLGQVAGSVGHELRNPLGVMNNAVYFLQTVLTSADQTTREYLGIIKSEIAGAERIVSDLLDAVRTKPPQPQLVSAKELLGMSLGNCRMPENIVLDLRAETQRPVLVDPFQMKQVFINLINNAVEAMPKGGRLTLGAADEQRAIRFTFRDEGAGIIPENRTRLFQPLFTTKARGIGLGLVVVKNLTEANGGTINVESEAGKGAVFTVTLPAGEA